MCVFCDIVDGKIPSKKVFENESLIAILDISQTTKGHTLIIPKKHFSNMLETDESILKEMISLSKTLGNKIVKNMNATGLNVLLNTNESAGQTVMHTHMHLIPRYDSNDSITIKFNENKYDLDQILEQIKR